MIVLSKNQGGSISPQAAYEKIASSEVTVLDVRNPDEFKQGHIKDAKLIPLGQLAERITEINTLKAKPIIVYCHAGSRSSAAAGKLRSQGFTGVLNLQGGITAWKNSKLPVVGG